MDGLECEEGSSLSEDESNENIINNKSTSAKRCASTTKRKKKQQTFCQSWLTVPEFKKWIINRIGKSGVMVLFCKPCQLEVTCSKTGLKRHASGVRHQENMKSVDSNAIIPTLFTSATDVTIELKVCAFIAENALPILISENLVSLLKSLFPRDLNLKSVKLGKQRTTNII